MPTSRKRNNHNKGKQTKEVPSELAQPTRQNDAQTSAGLPPFNVFRKSVEYLCILDFEATCKRQGKQRPNPQEIIEFPTLLFNVKTGQVEDEFHRYIRPDVHPQLSAFCTELTGIAQSKVDAGVTLSAALQLHREWLASHEIVPWHLCGSHEDKAFLYLTCGDWDLSTCLPRQLAYHGQKIPASFEAWINVKKAFSNKYMTKCKGMTFMLDHFGLELEGRHHSGIDDCRNIARVCQAMMAEGWKPKCPTN